MGRLFINKLKLHGKNKDYIIEFKHGLNYISGPTSTGKTSILEMINYALGSKKHKSYIEIGDSCTNVELEIEISGEKFRITRRLFEFTLPVKVELWDYNDQEFKYFDTFQVTAPSEDKSFSGFLIDKIGLGKVKIANQYLSFRDIFKYSYLKQTEIDTENLMGSETDYTKNTKRKNTFEIIFNIYDEMLGELKASLKQKKEEKDLFDAKLEGVSQFIDAADIDKASTYINQRKEITEKINNYKEMLISVKINNDKENDVTKELRKKIVNEKNEIRLLTEKKIEQEEYIDKLELLLNQYQNDIDKYEMLLIGIPEINKYKFIICPNCLRPLNEHNNSNCSLCNREMVDEIDNLIQIKKEKTQLKRRYTELKKHILSEKEKCSEYEKVINEKNRILSEDTTELVHLQEGYVNPQIEEIEYLNFEIGKSNRQIQEIETKLQMLGEYDRLKSVLKSKEEDISNLKKNIDKLSKEQNDKEQILLKLTECFNNYLKKFKFPKFDIGMIDKKNYLPYVRNRKYNDLGSLGGVTLIIIAYYLSIATMTLDDEKYYHLNLLMIDTPRKNLGVDASQEDFRDEEIFNSIIRTFIELDENEKDKLQLIIVNNGYPNFMPKEDIIVEYDSKEKIGLIDDARS